MSLQEQLEEHVDRHNRIVDQLTVLQEERLKTIGAIDVIQKLLKDEEPAAEEPSPEADTKA